MSSAPCQWRTLARHTRGKGDLMWLLACTHGLNYLRYPSPCRGDSGSGLMAPKSSSDRCSSCCEQWFVVGIDSFSEEFCGRHGNSNTAYISTLHHRGWIMKIVRWHISIRYLAFCKTFSFIDLTSDPNHLIFSATKTVIWRPNIDKFSSFCELLIVSPVSPSWFYSVTYLKYLLTTQTMRSATVI